MPAHLAAAAFICALVLRAQVFRGGEPYLKHRSCNGPSRSTVHYKCAQEVPPDEERLVEVAEPPAGSCHFRLTVLTRRVW